MACRLVPDGGQRYGLTLHSGNSIGVPTLSQSSSAPVEIDPGDNGERPDVIVEVTPQ